MTDSDGIEEALEAQFRIAITAAGQVGEQIARARENALRQAQEWGEAEARRLEARLSAERAAARTDLAGVRHAGWWENATGDQIAHAWQVARAWAADDVDVREAVTQIREQVRQRYGIDVDSTGANPADVRAALDQARADRHRAADERALVVTEEVEAALLMQQADAEDRRAESGSAKESRDRAGILYDSAERRQHLARDLEAQGIPAEVIATRVLADVSQARPPEFAVSTRDGTNARRRARPAKARRVDLAR